MPVTVRRAHLDHRPSGRRTAQVSRPAKHPTAALAACSGVAAARPPRDGSVRSEERDVGAQVGASLSSAACCSASARSRVATHFAQASLHS